MIGRLVSENILSKRPNREEWKAEEGRARRMHSPQVDYSPWERGLCTLIATVVESNAARKWRAPIDDLLSSPSSRKERLATGGRLWEWAQLCKMSIRSPTALLGSEPAEI